MSGLSGTIDAFEDDKEALCHSVSEFCVLGVDVLFRCVSRATRRGIDGTRKRACSGISMLRLVANGRGNGACHAMPVCGIGAEFAFLGVTEIPKLEKNGGDLRVSCKAKTAANKTAVAGFDGTDALHRTLTTNRKAMAVHTPEIGFRSPDGRDATIEVETEENGITVAVRQTNTLVEVDEGVITAQQDGTEVAAEFGLDPFCHIQSEILFLLSGVATDGAGIFTTVACVEYDRPESFWARAMAPFVETGGSAGGNDAREG